MMRVTFIIVLIILNCIVYGQFENVTLPRPKKATYPASQVEPSICINPKNTDEIIAGTVMNDYYYSSDGGQSWKAKSIKSKWGVNGDPCMLIDTLERYYYLHLSNIDGKHLVGGMVCQRSKKLKGKFKKEGHTKVNGKSHDKEWAVVNPLNNHIYMTWTQFDAYDSKDPKDLSHILFSKSEDGGENWSEPAIISKVPGDCRDNDLTAEGAVPAIGPKGEIYVAWARNDTLWFNCSFDDGKNWMDMEIPIATQKMGWVLDIPGIFRSNGLPVTVCDYSGSDFNGRIYVNWADQRNGVDNTDIWLISSSNRGKTWTDPVRINNDDSGKHQFLSWITVDQTNGYLYCVYYDRRNAKGNETEVYLARSKDGGETFDNYKISETPFTPSELIFFGDYINISVHDGVIRPIWMRLHEGKISLHTAIVNESKLN